MTTHADPIALFTAAVDALYAQDFLAVARLCDPMTLTWFKRNQVAQYQSRVVPPSVDQLLAAKPDLPRAAAEWQVSTMQRTTPAARFSRDFPDLASPNELETLSPEDLFARTLRARSRGLGSSNATANASPNASDARSDGPSGESRFPRFSYTPIGFVTDGDDIAHVVYRQSIEAPTHATVPSPHEHLSDDERALMRKLEGRTPAQIMSCTRQNDGGWLLIADVNFFHLSMGSMTAFAFLTKDSKAPPTLGGDPSR